MRESEELVGLAPIVASPTVAMDRAMMGMGMGTGTDRMAGRDEAAKSLDVDERRAAMVVMGGGGAGGDDDDDDNMSSSSFFFLSLSFQQNRLAARD